MCNCKANEVILALVILVFALWQTTYSKWVIIVAAILLLIHSLGCKDLICGTPITKPKKKKR